VIDFACREFKHKALAGMLVAYDGGNNIYTAYPLPQNEWTIEIEVTFSSYVHLVFLLLFSLFAICVVQQRLKTMQGHNCWEARSPCTCVLMWMCGV
jgi:hypothetical protein